MSEGMNSNAKRTRKQKGSKPEGDNQKTRKSRKTACDVPSCQPDEARASMIEEMKRRR